MLEMFTLTFMQRALLTGLIVAIVCPAIGLFLILRRMAQFGDALAHVSLAGAAVGLMTRTYPVAIGMAFSILAAMAMDWLRQSYRKYSELAVAIMLSAAVALAVTLLSATQGAGANVLGYFWGSLMTVSATDVSLIGTLGALVLVVLFLLYKELLSVTFDEEHARISGLPVRLINAIYMVLTAMTVAMAMRVVGFLLVSSLMVVPVATALQLARSFRSALLWAVLFGLLSVTTGLILSYVWNLAPGGMVVLTAVLILVLVVGYKRLRGIE